MTHHPIILVLIVGAGPTGLTLVREQAVPAIVNMTPIRRRILAAVSRLSIGYRDSPLSVDGDARVDIRRPLRRDARGLRAGDRVPDASLIDAASGESVSLFDLFARGWTLLLLPDNNAAPDAVAQLMRIAEQIQDAVREALRSYLVLDTLADGGASTVLLDPSGEVTRTSGVRNGPALANSHPVQRRSDRRCAACSSTTGSIWRNCRDGLEARNSESHGKSSCRLQRDDFGHGVSDSRPVHAPYRRCQ